MELDRIIAVRNTKTIFRDGNRCIKLFSPEHSCEEVMNEAYNTAAASGAGIKVPKVLEVTEINGKWAIISEFIRGKSLAELMKEKPQAQEEYIEILAALHRQTAGVTCPLLHNIKDILNIRIEQCSLSDEYKYELHLMLNSISGGDKMLHGELIPSNIIITPDEECWLVDWSDSAKGDPMFDIAVTYLNFLADKELVTAERFLEKSFGNRSSQLRAFENWLPSAAAAMSVSESGERRAYLLEYAEKTLVGKEGLL